MPRRLSPLFPDFDGPHFVSQGGFKNTSKYGVQRIQVEMIIDMTKMNDDNLIDLTFAINEVEVAEATVQGTDDIVHMDDIIFPPITDLTLELKLEVSAFRGTISSSNEAEAPGGVGLVLGEEGINTFTM